MPARLLIPLVALALAPAACTAANVKSTTPSVDVEYKPLRAGNAQAELDDEVVLRLQSEHYSPVDLDDDFSRELLNTYLDDLDGSHSVFLASDVAYFRDRYGASLDEALKQANLEAAFEIYNVYQKRRIQIDQWLLDKLSDGLGSLNLDDDERLRLDREDADWPADPAARRALWTQQLENQVITMRLNDVADDKIHKRLTRRYESELEQLRNSEPTDVIAAYMGAYTSLYDPHTTYFTPRRTEDFKIGMNLSLQGIGAQLRSRNGYPELVRLIPGGPAANSGELEPTDRITAVGQGKDGEFTDVVGMRLGEAVQLIRGEKGTTVRLRIMSKDGSETKTVPLVRDKIELKDRDASKRIIEVERDGETRRVGLIELPSFYKGTADDVRTLLEELKKADVNRVVVDLRNNGGGALREVTKLVGLFMPPAPSVQIRTADGETQVQGDSSQGAVYKGPMAVMVNRLSASASEIFAGAIQDYGRGLIVGSDTFGKGTVQALTPVSAGRVKLTQAKFYRVTGASTQRRGVTPDIPFPAIVDSGEIGESALPNALPWDKIDAVEHPHSDKLQNMLGELRSRHEQRASNAPDFQYRVNRIKLARQRTQREKLSLNIQKRRQSREKHQQKLLELANARREKIGKKPFDDYQAFKDSEESESPQQRAGSPDPSDDELDAYQKEAANILLDMRALLRASPGRSI